MLSVEAGQATDHPQTTAVLRVYMPDECGPDGYPLAWHRIDGGPGIKHLVREQAGHRCLRCHHPYAKGVGEWSPCDEHCRHGGPVRYWTPTTGWGDYDGTDETIADHVAARWRILTVHHLTGDKADCRWWNLAALCQRCHLTIQGRVVMARVYPWEHSAWFRPHAAGWYAWTYLGLDLSRDEALARQDELLALERLA